MCFSIQDGSSVYATGVSDLRSSSSCMVTNHVYMLDAMHVYKRGVSMPRAAAL